MFEMPAAVLVVLGLRGGGDKLLLWIVCMYACTYVCKYVCTCGKAWGAMTGERVPSIRRRRPSRNKSSLLCVWSSTQGIDGYICVYGNCVRVWKLCSECVCMYISELQ